MIRAREGDHDAFAELTARSIGRLTAAARLILRDEYRAQDAVQDALLVAWRSLPGLRNPDSYEAWLRKLLVRACFSRVRHDRHRGQLEIRLTPADEPAVVDAAGQVALHDQLERGLARLPAEQRAVLVLVYYLDLPLADAARALSIPLGTTKSRLNRATQSLRALIDADERGPARSAERMTT